MKLSRLTNEQLAAIAAAQQPGAGVAEAILVERNRGLIFSTARKYGRAFDIDDAYGIAAYGFVVAVRKFDASRGWRLTTFTVIWMRQALGRARENSGFIRTPSHIMELVPQVHKARELMGRDVTAAQIAKALKVTVTRVQAAMDAIERQSPLSLDMPLSEDGGVLGDIVGTTPSVEAEVLRHVSEFDLSMLDPREASVLAYTLDGMTYPEAGERMGISRERVRQLRDRALGKLRAQAVTLCN